MHWAAVQGATFHQWQPEPLVLRFIKALTYRRQGRSTNVTPTLSLVATALLPCCYHLATTQPGARGDAAALPGG